MIFCWYGVFRFLINQICPLSSMVLTLYNVCAVHWWLFSALWGYHHCNGGVSWFVCGISWLHWVVFSALGEYKYCCGTPPLHWYRPHKSWYPPMHWWYPPNALTISPQCTAKPKCTADTLYRAVFPYLYATYCILRQTANNTVQEITMLAMRSSSFIPLNSHVLTSNWW